VSILARCSGAGVVYGSGPAAVVALGGIDLEVREGERLALLGRSGSGKTTLLHVLGGLVEPTSGELEVETERPALVFQSANLLPHFTAYENVAFTGAEQADELLALVGLGAKLDALPSEMSGGEQQRVAIARALGQEPDLLLCDEPTGHLDSDTGRRVLDLIDALQERFGFALVTATHDVDVAARADRMITLADGGVLDQEEMAA
jgi:putative ABC transport system ATP-binding protein